MQRSVEGTKDGDTMTKYVEPNEGGLFDKAARLEELHGMGDPLARLDQVIDWTLFEPVFARIPSGRRISRSKGFDRREVRRLPNA